MQQVILEIKDFSWIYIIKWIPLITLLAITFQNIFKLNLDVIYNLARWVLVAFAILIILNMMLSYGDFKNDLTFRNRTMGKYAYAHWIMIFFNSVFPLLLIDKYFGRNKYFVFFVSLMINIGWLFELFIIIMSLHKEYI